MTEASAFAPAKDMLLARDAQAALMEAVAPVRDAELVTLIRASGRVLAQDLIATRNVPPFDNAAVDGYAVFTEDLPEDGTVALPLAGRVTAGGIFAGAMGRGTALRVFTGAALPAGPNTVVPQELCQEADGKVTVPARRHAENVRPRGEDVREGMRIVAAGTRLRPQEVGLAAAQGLAHLKVIRRPKVALFSTGNELRDPGTDSGPGVIYDSNRFVLNGLLQCVGAEVIDFGILPDRARDIGDALVAAAAATDFVLTSGGVSTGEEDHVKAAVRSNGVLHFWRVAIRPGRPLVFGRVGTAPLLGLPGNPVANMICFLIFARPLLLRLAGARPEPPQYYPVTADFAFTKRVGRREWVRASLVRDEAGCLLARRYPREGSGILTSLAASTGIVELPEELDEVRPGATVDYLPFAEVLG